jgi:hypothetical protein
MAFLDDIFGMGVASPSDRVITPDPTRVKKPEIDLYSPHGYRRKQPMPNIPGKLYKWYGGLGLEDPNHPALRAASGGRAPPVTVKPKDASIASLTTADWDKALSEAHGMGGWNTEVAPVVPKAVAKPKAPPQSFLSKALGFDDKSGKSSYLTELGLRMASRKDKKGPLSFLTDPLLETYEGQAKKEAAAAKFGLEKQRTEAAVLTSKAAMEQARATAALAGKTAADKRKQNALVLALRKNGLEADDFSTLAASNPDLMKKVMEDAKEFYHVDFTSTMAGGSTGRPYTAVGTTGVPGVP